MTSEAKGVKMAKCVYVRSGKVSATKPELDF